jgi:hypothetical protein
MERIEGRRERGHPIGAAMKTIFPLLVDDMSNQADSIYAGWPERLYIIGADRRIAYKGKTGPFGYHPEEVEAWLEERFPRSTS